MRVNIQKIIFNAIEDFRILKKTTSGKKMDKNDRRKILKKIKHYVWGREYIYKNY